MAKRPKRPRDPMQLAKLIGDIATGQVENVKPTAPHPDRRKGGLKCAFRPIVNTQIGPS